MIVYNTAYNKAYNTGVNLLFNEISGVMDEPRACFQSRFKSWIYIFVPCTIFSMWNCHPRCHLCRDKGFLKGLSDSRFFQP